MGRRQPDSAAGVPEIVRGQAAPAEPPARPARPTPADLAAAAAKTVPDVAAPGLRVLFCGINPGLYSAATGHHFARPGNRFWPTLHAAGFTPRLFRPGEPAALLALGYGITNVVPRASAAAAELTTDEIVAGGRVLRRKVRRLQPTYLAVLGLGAYRVAFDRPAATTGPQPDDAVGDTRVWVLPNPSGLNVFYQHRLVDLFRELRAAADAAGSAGT